MKPQKINFGFNPAIAITLVRLFLSPILVWALLTKHWVLSCILLFIALSTDFLDGFIARKFGIVTNFGALLDTLADKVIMLALTGCVLVSTSTILPSWFIILVLAKELMVFAGAAYLWLSDTIVTTTPIYVGKITMAVQMGVFLWALANQALGIPFFETVLYPIVGLLLFTLSRYILVFTQKIHA